MKDTISPRQAALFAFASSSAPVITVCAGASWVWTLLISAAAALIAWRLFALWKRAGADLPSLVLAICGKTLGAVLLVLAAAFAALVLMRFAAWTDSAFPETATKPFVPLVLLAITVWSAWKGSAACVRAVAVVSLMLLALYAAIFLFALPDAQPARLLSQNAVFSPSLSVALLPLSLVWFAAPGQGRSARLTVLAVSLLPLLTSAVCAMIPGSGGSFYVMAETVNVLSVGSRIEPLVSAALTAGWFAAMCMPILAAGRISEALFGKSLPGVLACASFAVPGTLLGFPDAGEIMAIGASIFCVIFPLGILQIAVRKKRKKL